MSEDSYLDRSGYSFISLETSVQNPRSEQLTETIKSLQPILEFLFNFAKGYSRDQPMARHILDEFDDFIDSMKSSSVHDWSTDQLLKSAFAEIEGTSMMPSIFIPNCSFKPTMIETYLQAGKLTALQGSYARFTCLSKKSGAPKFLVGKILSCSMGRNEKLNIDFEVDTVGNDELRTLLLKTMQPDKRFESNGPWLEEGVNQRDEHGNMLMFRYEGSLQAASSQVCILIPEKADEHSAQSVTKEMRSILIHSNEGMNTCAAKLGIRTIANNGSAIDQSNCCALIAIADILFRAVLDRDASQDDRHSLALILRETVSNWDVIEEIKSAVLMAQNKSEFDDIDAYMVMQIAELSCAGRDQDDERLLRQKKVAAWMSTSEKRLTVVAQSDYRLVKEKARISQCMTTLHSFWSTAHVKSEIRIENAAAAFAEVVKQRGKNEMISEWDLYPLADKLRQLGIVDLVSMVMPRYDTSVKLRRMSRLPKPSNPFEIPMGVMCFASSHWEALDRFKKPDSNKVLPKMERILLERLDYLHTTTNSWSGNDAIIASLDTNNSMVGSARQDAQEAAPLLRSAQSKNGGQSMKEGQNVKSQAKPTHTKSLATATSRNKSDSTQEKRSTAAQHSSAKAATQRPSVNEQAKPKQAHVEKGQAGNRKPQESTSARAPIAPAEDWKMLRKEFPKKRQNMVRWAQQMGVPFQYVREVTKNWRLCVLGDRCPAGFGCNREHPSSAAANESLVQTTSSRMSSDIDTRSPRQRSFKPLNRRSKKAADNASIQPPQTGETAEQDTILRFEKDAAFIANDPFFETVTTLRFEKDAASIAADPFFATETIATQLSQAGDSAPMRVEINAAATTADPFFATETIAIQPLQADDSTPMRVETTAAATAAEPIMVTTKGLIHFWRGDGKSGRHVQDHTATSAKSGNRNQTTYQGQSSDRVIGAGSQ